MIRLLRTLLRLNPTPVPRRTTRGHVTPISRCTVPRNPPAPVKRLPRALAAD